MTARIPCDHCLTNIEFDVQDKDTTVACPACEQLTHLRIPAAHQFIVDRAQRQEERAATKALSGGPKKIETTLESIATLLIVLGIGGAAIIGISMAYQNETRRLSDEALGTLFFIAVGWLVQCWIMSALFRGFAEIIRQLRALNQRQK